MAQNLVKFLKLEIDIYENKFCDNPMGHWSCQMYFIYPHTLKKSNSNRYKCFSSHQIS
jgi:hypothetical protein